MSKTRIILVICFLAAFGAGMTASAALTRARRPEARKPWIEEELKLTVEQREKMREIWSEVMGKLRDFRRDRRQALQEERDEAIQNLLSVQQRTEYAEILKIYARESAALYRAAGKAFEDATRRTREEILTEKQLEAYDRMLQERAGRRRHGSRESREDKRGGADTPLGPENEEPGPPPPPPLF